LGDCFLMILIKESSININIRNEESKDYRRVKYKGALDEISGYADFSAVFDLTQEEVDEFDQSFLDFGNSYGYF